MVEDKEVTTALLCCGWGWQIKKAEEGKASMLWAEALPEATDAAKVTQLLPYPYSVKCQHQKKHLENLILSQ